MLKKTRKKNAKVIKITKIRTPKTPKTISTNPLRQTDSELAVLDSACTMAEEILRPLLKFYSAESVAEAFKEHLQCHLLEELTNIEAHGHRNDDPADPPPPSDAAVYALVTISGGVGDIAICPRWVDVDILDFDNLWDLINLNEKLSLSDREWTYLKENDPEAYEAAIKLKAD
jgi:hypothetical protein